MKYVSPLDKLANHDCTDCALHEGTERVCVMGSGSKKSKIMVIGEAPGENEARTGRVFSGRAGQLLDIALKDAGLERDSLYVTNVVKCRPDDNRRPSRIEWEACRQYLEREAAALSPSHVLLLGNTALQVVARKSGITTKRGVRLDIKDPVWSSAEVMATIHPAFVLRNPGQGTTFSEDIRRFARMVHGEFRAVTVRPKMVRTLKGLEFVRDLLLNAPERSVVSYDVENRGRPWEPEWDIVCLGISVDGETTYVIPLSHPESPFRKNWQKVLRYLAPALRRHGHKLVAQNGKHDNAQLAGAGVYLRHTFDIMLAAHLLDENRPKNLGFLSQNVIGADVYKGMVELKPEKIMGEPLRKICEYNGYDVGYTHQIYHRVRKELLKEPRLTRLFVKLMMPASHVIQEVETVGMYVNQELMWDRIAILQNEIGKRKEVLYDHLPKKWEKKLDITPSRRSEGFNFNSTQQVGKWLFSKKGLGLSPIELTATGNPSTREAVLLHYHTHPAVRALLEYRTLELKWLRTYLLPWSTKLDSRSRLHTTYKLYGTVTGRLSGDLQQVPRDTFIRGVIGAPPGWVFVQADYSQIELRIAAHCAQERRMRRAFLAGEDLHMLTAISLTGKPGSLVSKEERKKAKAVNFGFLYGMYPRKFQQYAFENYELEVSLAEAEQARKQYFDTFPDLVAWHDRQRRVAHNYHRVVSPLGRVRHLPDILSSDNGVRMEAERQAINSPVQATASDLMLFSMVKLHAALDPKEAFMVGTLHDAIFFQIKEDAVDKWVPLIKDTMENLPLKKTFGFEPIVPIIADLDYGQQWQGTPDASGLGMDKLIAA
jgi:uracil-DNA glycosylase family 4